MIKSRHLADTSEITRYMDNWIQPVEERYDCLSNETTSEVGTGHRPKFEIKWLLLYKEPRPTNFQRISFDSIIYCRYILSSETVDADEKCFR